MARGQYKAPEQEDAILKTDYKNNRSSFPIVNLEIPLVCSWTPSALLVSAFHPRRHSHIPRGRQNFHKVSL